jgi:hypothetical protein
MHHSFLKLEIIIILIILKEKGVEIGEIHVYTHFGTFGSNVYLTLTIVDLKMCFTQKLFIFW